MGRVVVFRDVLPVVFVVAALLQSAAAKRTFVVGDSLGWTVPPKPDTYAVWASNHTFVVDDILLFLFEAGKHTVARVSKEAYDSCNTTTTPFFIRRKPPVRVSLNTTGLKFFIDTVGDHCVKGQKLSVNVIPLPGTPNSPPQQPPTSPSPPPTTSPPTSPPPSPPTNAPPSPPSPPTNAPPSPPSPPSPNGPPTPPSNTPPSSPKTPPASPPSPPTNTPPSPPASPPSKTPPSSPPSTPPTSPPTKPGPAAAPKATPAGWPPPGLSNGPPPTVPPLSSKAPPPPPPVVSAAAATSVSVGLLFVSIAMWLVSN